MMFQTRVELLMDCYEEIDISAEKEMKIIKVRINLGKETNVEYINIPVNLTTQCMSVVRL